MEERETQTGKTPQMCLIHGDFKHFATPNGKQFRHFRKVSSIMLPDAGRVTFP
jgi:hypothetical protein